MKWAFWRRKKDTGVAEAQLALAAARAGSHQVKKNRREAERIAASLRDIRHTNGFAERIEEMYRDGGNA